MDSIALWNTESKRFKCCDGILKILQQFWGTTVLGSYQWITKNHFPKFDKYNKVKYIFYFNSVFLFFVVDFVLFGTVFFVKSCKTHLYKKKASVLLSFKN